MDTSIAVALITSCTGIIIAGIGAWASTTKAVTAATEPLHKKIAADEVTMGEQAVTIQHLLEMLELKGTPHDL